MRLVLTFFFASLLICRAEEAVSGRWEGAVRIPGAERKLIVDLAQDHTDAWTGSIIIPGVLLKGASLTDIVVNGPEVAFAMKAAGRGLEAIFKAHLNPDGTLAGEFVQAGNRAPFTLKKIGPPQVEMPPKSTAITNEIEGEWTGQYELFGYPRKVTITLTNRPAEGALAKFVIVGRKTNDLPVDLVTQEGGLLTIDSHGTGISYEGRFKKGEIKGTIVQGPLEIPLILRRTK